MKVEELRIPAPWGNIAAKAWGNSDGPTVVAVHGIGDNAASFDRLIPLLPKNFYYVCIDLPGHGRSSAFPKGTPIYFEYLLLSMKLVMDFFEKDIYILMGHGLGAALCTFIAQIYSETLSKLILIDATTSWPSQPSRLGKQMKETIGNTIEAIKSKEKTYSFKEVKNILKNSKQEGELTSEVCKVLLQRMAKKTDKDKYVFTPDARLSRILYPALHIEDIKRFLKTSPVRQETIYINFTETSSRYSEYKEKTWNLLPARRYLIKGHHYYHLTNPESISGVLSDFLLNESSKL